MSRHWWVIVGVFVAFGVAGRIDYEASQSACEARAELSRS